jgi:hypothetical protein
MLTCDMVGSGPPRQLQALEDAAARVIGAGIPPSIYGHADEAVE